MVDELFAGWDLDTWRQTRMMARGAYFEYQGYQAEWRTIRNGMATHGIKKSFQPKIDVIEKRMKTRQVQIDSDKTSAEDKKKFIEDQEKDKKLHAKLNDQMMRKTKPYEMENQSLNGQINEVAQGLNLFVSGNNFRDRIALMDRYHGLYTGEASTGSTTPFAPPTTGSIVGMAGGTQGQAGKHAA